METEGKPATANTVTGPHVPPSGGSLEIGNCLTDTHGLFFEFFVPPSGGSLEIGNPIATKNPPPIRRGFSFGGIYRIGNLGIPSWKEIRNREKIRVKPVLLGRGQAALLVLRPLLEG